MDNDETVYTGEMKPPGGAKRQRILGRVLLCVSLAPWLNLAIWVLFALTARRALDHFPHAYWEDAPELVWAFFYPLVTASFFLVLASLPLWCWLKYSLGKSNMAAIVWRAKMVFGLGWMTTIFLALVDPVHFLRWFID